MVQQVGLGVVRDVGELESDDEREVEPRCHSAPRAGEDERRRVAEEENESRTSQERIRHQ